MSIWNFNETLTYDVFSFEPLGPVNYVNGRQKLSPLPQDGERDNKYYSIYSAIKHSFSTSRVTPNF